VVECDSSTTEAHIYKECNALEFLSSPLDLRFIPDIWEFKLEPRDAVTEVFSICIRFLCCMIIIGRF
jgi:hypothetical protein